MKSNIQTERPIYGVFILESMDLSNEQQGHLDGWILKTILDLCGIENSYFYFRTKRELKEIMKVFKESNFGFLHISCHGSETNLQFTYDTVDFVDLSKIIAPYLYRRRLFLSACKAARFELAEHFIPKHHCLSVIGTPDDINYDKAAVFWSSFYYLMHEMNPERMPQRILWPILENVSKSFALNLNYFSIIGKSRRSIDHLREFHYESGKITLDEVKKTKFSDLTK